MITEKDGYAGTRLSKENRSFKDEECTFTPSSHINHLRYDKISIKFLDKTFYFLLSKIPILFNIIF